MKCWSFVVNITVLCTNAPFPPFPMPSSNLIGFGIWRYLTFRWNNIFVRVIHYLLWKSYSKYSDKKTRNTLVNAKAHCTKVASGLRRATWYKYFSPAEQKVTNIVTDVLNVSLLSRRSKGAHYFQSCWSSGNYYTSMVSPLANKLGLLFLGCSHDLNNVRLICYDIIAVTVLNISRIAVLFTWLRTVYTDWATTGNCTEYLHSKTAINIPHANVAVTISEAFIPALKDTSSHRNILCT